jgi:hypothetical protein
VVEVTVRNEYCAYAIFVVLEVFGVGEEVVDARGLVLGNELKARVKDEDVSSCLKGDHVATHLFNAT